MHPDSLKPLLTKPLNGQEDGTGEKGGRVGGRCMYTSPSTAEKKRSTTFFQPGAAKNQAEIVFLSVFFFCFSHIKRRAAPLAGRQPGGQAFCFPPPVCCAFEFEQTPPSRLIRLLSVGGLMRADVLPHF